MNQFQTRINALRKKMKEAGADACMVQAADYHQSDYIAEHFKFRHYLTGFTGLAGTFVLTADEALLWADGRYFIQAPVQLAGSGVELMKIGVAGVPALDEYLFEKIPEGGSLLVDGRTLSVEYGVRLERLFKKKNIRMITDVDPADGVWEDRPPMPMDPIWVLGAEYCGKSATDKLSEVRAKMKKAGASAHLLSTPDDIAWLLNIRGNDVVNKPLALSFVLMTSTETKLFIDEKKLEGPAPYGDISDIHAYFESIGVEVYPYSAVSGEVEKLRGEKVLIEFARTNFELYRLLDESNEAIDGVNPEALMKAVKNPVEIENMKRAHIKDGVAITKFLYWLKKNVEAGGITELSAAQKLDSLRFEQEGCFSRSFRTISGYGKNAAIGHYMPDDKNNDPLLPKGLYVVDSGGQYFEGTTDITRTVVLGPLTGEERLHFTLVLIAMLRLGNAKFPYGCRGMALDYAAREPLWQRGINFDHGTGHGVGFALNVHERPNNIRYNPASPVDANAILEEGMITSDEPGIYIEGSHGVRIENLILCIKAEKNEFAQFMKFEYLTLAPIDIDGIDPCLMNDREKTMLNEYHKRVRETISPYLTEEEGRWLEKVTAAI